MDPDADRYSIPELIGAARKQLDLDPYAVDGKTDEGKVIRKVLGSLGQIVSGVGEIRNLVGTGHGRVRASGIDPTHARLVVNAAAAVALFFVELWEQRPQREPIYLDFPFRDPAPPVPWDPFADE